MSRLPASRRAIRRRVITLDPGFADHWQQIIDEERARRAEIVTVTVLPTRLPAEPLVRLVEGRGGLHACLGRHRSPADARRLERAYRRACSKGYVPWRAADTLAVELLGLHSMLAWVDA